MSDPLPEDQPVPVDNEKAAVITRNLMMSKRDSGQQRVRMSQESWLGRGVKRPAHVQT